MSIHLNFSLPTIKSTSVNLKYFISIHSKSIRTQNFFGSREEAAFRGNTQVDTDDTNTTHTEEKRSDALKYINTPTVGLIDQ